MTNVSRIVSLGSSVCRILRVSEALGGSGTNGLVSGSGSAERTLLARVFEVWRLRRLEVTNVSRVVSLGGSICCILRVSEALGGSGTNGLVSGSGSA